MRKTILSIIILGFMFTQLVSAIPDFQAKWDICNEMNITNNTACDIWWYNLNVSEIMINNYTIIENFNISNTLLSNLTNMNYTNFTDNYWNKTLTLNTTEINSLIDSKISTLNTSGNTALAKIEEVKATMNANDLDLDAKIKDSNFNVVWQMIIILTFFMSLGVIGYIIYELKK